MDKVLKGVAAVVVLGIVVYVVWRNIPRDGGPDRCELLAKQRTASVDISATVGDLKLLETKIGVAAGQVQEVDQILKDYAFRYTTACRDNAATPKIISDAEYNCRRDNMEKVLSSTRTLGLTLDAAKSIADPAAQKDIVLKNLEIIKDLSRNDYSKGCGSALTASPQTLRFEGSATDRILQVANSGNRDLRYTVTNLPEAFIAIQLSGDVPVGHAPVVVGITRSAHPVVADVPVTFYVSDNFNNKVPVQIVVDAANARLYTRLGEAVIKEKAADHQEPTLEDAMATVSRSFPEVTSAGTRALLAAGALKEAGSFRQANRALEALSAQNTALYQAPSTQLLAAIVDFSQNDRTAALEHLATAGSAPGAGEQAKTAAKLASGAVWLSDGNTNAAKPFLIDPDVRNRVVGDATFSDYVGRQFKVANLDKAVMAAAKPFN
jgi:hypothetical protein